MKQNIAIIFILLICASNAIGSDSIFKPVKYDYNNKTVLIPEGFSYSILYAKGDDIYTNDGKKAKAKGSQDLVIYIPINNSNEHGYLYVSHEGREPDSILGDGGGGAILEVKKTNGVWAKMGDVHSIDFSTVGETFRNCGGTLTPHGTILSAEEERPQSNTELIKRFGITDTSDFNGKKKFLNYGWMVEIDPISRKAIRKVKNFGRYPHEDAQCMPDGKTVYLTADSKPAVLFKFIAEKANDYSKGQLFAYKQSEDGNSGNWVKLPMDEESLENIINVSLTFGATMFISHEWIDVVGDKLYITESGSDNFDFIKEVKAGGKAARHLDSLCSVGENKYKDPFGRILELDLITNKIRVLVNGGVSSKDSAVCFSSPDAMTAVRIKGKDYLVISEDTHGWKNGTAGAAIAARKETYNEIYFLDLSIANPTLDDLQRFMFAPEGCETTGNFFTADAKNYFLAIQHPSTTNPAPFNKSCVIAITGF